jgi:RHS repeat-associated protein
VSKFQRVVARILVFAFLFTAVQFNFLPGTKSNEVVVKAASATPPTYVPAPGDNANGDTTITTRVEINPDNNVIYYYSHNVVIANGGTLFLKNGACLEIRGNLTVQGTGTIAMSEDNAALTIKGNWNVGNTNKCNLSGKCVIEVEGNIIQTGADNINFGANNVISLTGSQQQTINFQDTEDRIRIWTLENKNTSKLPLVFNSALNFDKYIDNGYGITGYVGAEKAVVVKNRLQFFRFQGIGGWLNKELVIDGNLYIKPTANEVNITQSEEDMVTLRVKGDFKQEGGYFKTFGQRLVITGNFVQSGGTFEVMGNKAQVEVNNDMTISGAGVLKMNYTGSRVIVNGNFTTSSTASHAGCLTAGTIEIKKNFLQDCSSTPTVTQSAWPGNITPAMALNFCAVNSGTELQENEIPPHRVILNGTGTQTVEFKSATQINPTDKSLKTRMSQFSILTIMQPKYNYKFKNNLSVERIYEKLEDLSINKDSDKPYILKSIMKTPRTHFGLVCADGNMFAIGGTNNSTTFDDVDMYDSQGDNWSDLLTMKIARKDLAVAQNGSNIYVFGGTNGSGTLSTTGETFSTTSTSTSYIQNTSLQNINFVARKEHQAAYLNGKIYIMGGSNATSTLSTLEVYNPTTQALETSLAPKAMNTARKNFGASVALIDGKYAIVAAGGENGSTVLNSVESYDPSTNLWTTWATTSFMKVKRKGFGLAFVCGKLYAFGGMNDLGQYVKSVEVYDDTTKTWTLIDREPSVARAFFGSTAAFNSIFIAGGENTTGVLDTFEQFLPTALAAVRLKGDKKSINGDFTQDETDLSFNSSVMDFELSRTYNTQFKDDINTYLGRGWKFNLESSVKPVTGSVGEITASLLYIRDNPYGDILGGIDRGTVVSYDTANNKTDKDGKIWYKLNLPGTCYVASWYVKSIIGNTVEVEYPSGMKGYFTCPSGGASGNCTRNFGTYEDLYFDSKGTTAITTDDVYTMTAKDQTKYTYTMPTGDTAYRNTKITDKFGNTMNIVYGKQVDGNPSLEAQLLDKNSVIIRKITILKKPAVSGVYTVEATDNTNRKITYTVDVATSQLKSVVNAVNMTTSYDYYTSTKAPINYAMMRATKDGKEMAYATYDDSGRIKSVKDPDGNTTTYHYEDIFIDESGTTPKVIGNLRRCTVDAKNHETIVTYNVVEKRPIYEVNAEKDIARYKYEVCTNETTQTFLDVTNLKEDSDFYKNTYSTDAFSKAQHSTRETTTDANKQRTVITKNLVGDITLVVNPDNTKKKFQFDSLNNLTKETIEEANGTVVSSKKYEYDATNVYLKKIFNDANATAEDVLYYYSGCDTAYAGKNLKGLVMQKVDTREGTTKVTTDYDYNSAGELTYEKTGTRITYYAHRYGALTAQTNFDIKDKDGSTTKKTVVLDNPPNSFERNNIYYTVAKLTPAGNIQIVYHDPNLKVIKTSMKDNAQTKASHSLFTYDKLGRKEREVSPETYSKNPAAADTLTQDCLYYTYYNSGNVSTSKDPENNTTTFLYDAAGNIEKETKPDGSAYLYEYDGIDRTSRIKFVAKGSTEGVTLEEYVYNDGKQIANPAPDRASMKRERKYYDNQTYLDTYYYYDYSGRLAKLDDPYKVLENQYYADGNIKSERVSQKDVDAYGNTTFKDISKDCYYYNSRGNQEIKLSQIGDNLYNVTKYEYYADGLKKHEASWANAITYSTLDVKPDIATLIGTKKAKVSKFTYDDLDKIESELVYMGNVSPASLFGCAFVEKDKYVYEPDGNLSEETNIYTLSGEKSVERYEYNYLGKPSRKLVIVKKEDLVTDATDSVEAVTGDTTVSALVTTYDYYLDGNVKSVTDPSKDKMEYTYDDMGRLLTTTYSGSSAIPGSTCGIKDEEGIDLYKLTSVNEYDWNGKVTKTKTVSEYPLYGPKYAGTTRTYNSIDYNYDSRGFLLNTIQKITDANGNTKDIVHACQYDFAGRLVAEASPESFKNVVCDHTNCKDQYTLDKAESKTLYSYDLLGRLQTKTFNGIIYENFDPKTVTFVTKAYQYDAAGNVTKEVDGKQYLDAFRNGMSVSQIISAAKGKEYAYNMNGKMDKIYTPVEKVKLNGGAVLQYAYDGLGDVVKETEQKGASGIGSMKTYSVDTTNTSSFNSDGTVTYTRTTQYTDTGANPYTSAALTTSWKVDMQGNTVSEKKGSKREITKQYNAFGQEKLIDAFTDTDESSLDVKNQTKNYYDVDGNLKIRKNSLDVFEIYDYDSLGKVTTKTIGKKKAGVVKADSLITASDLEDTVVNKFSYDVVGNSRFITDGNDFKTEYIYDVLNRVTSTKQRYLSYGLSKYMNREKRNTYDLNGNVIVNSEYIKDDTEPYESMLKYEAFKYDGLDRNVEKSVDCNNGYAPILVERLEYNENSDQLYSYDVFGNRVEFIYDDNRRVIDTIDQCGHSIKKEYDCAGNICKITDSTGNITHYYYDALDRLKEIKYMDKTTDAESQAVSTYSYNTEGNISEVKMGSKVNVSFAYTDSDLVKERWSGYTVDAGGTKLGGKKENYYYYADGNLRKSVNSSNSVTATYDYKPQGWLKTETTVKGTDTYLKTYSYDGNGNCTNTSVTYTENGTQVSYATTRYYDSLGRVYWKVLGEIDGYAQYIYDYFFEGFECEISKYGNGKASTKVLDRTGKIRDIYGVDVSDTSITPEQKQAVRTEYKYDDKGRRIQVVYPNNASTVYTYYNDDLLNTLTNYINGYHFFIFFADGTEIEKYVYSYYNNHKMSSKQEYYDGSSTPTNTVSYNYDELGRLKKVIETGRTIDYTYDDSGNRKTETIIAGGITTLKDYYYTSDNLLDYYTSKDNGVLKEKKDYDYDVNGNQTYEYLLVENGIDLGANKKTLAKHEYNILDQVVKTTSKDYVIENTYNSEGMRIKKKVGKFDQNQVLQPIDTYKITYEYDKVVFETSYNNTSNYTWNLYGVNLISRTINDSTYYCMFNGHADVTRLIDQQGKPVERYYYDEWGVETKSVKYGDIDLNGKIEDNDTGLLYSYLYSGGTLTDDQKIPADLNGDGNINIIDYSALIQLKSGSLKTVPADKNSDGFVNEKCNIKYAGYAYDGETGLYYLGSRFYDPDIARFIQEDTETGDPNDPLSLNLYTYCHNEPLMYQDPDGHAIKWYQAGSVIKGAARGIIDEFSLPKPWELVDSFKSLKELASEIASGEVNAKDLIQLGLNAVFEDFIYVYNNRNVLLDDNSYSGKKVEEFSFHATKAIMQTISMVAGGAGTVLKIKNMISKVKGIKKMKKALDISKSFTKVAERVAQIPSNVEYYIKRAQSTLSNTSEVVKETSKKVTKKITTTVQKAKTEIKQTAAKAKEAFSKKSVEASTGKKRKTQETKELGNIHSEKLSEADVKKDWMDIEQSRGKGNGNKSSGKNTQVEDRSYKSNKAQRTPYEGSTADEVARKVLESANKKSIRKNKEYGGMIYEKNGKYYATIPVAGSSRSIDIKSKKMAMNQVPNNAKIVGDYHTHGDYSILGKNDEVIRTGDKLRDDFNSDNFSRSDRTSAYLGRDNFTEDFRSYLGTPSGEFKVITKDGDGVI